MERLRKTHPGLGAEKLQLFLADWCKPRHFPSLSLRTVMWRVAERPGLEKARSSRVKINHHRAAHERKPKRFKADYPGNCASVDTIELQRDVLKRYISTFTDLHNRFALAAASASKTNKRTSVRWQLSRVCFPYPIERRLSVNGSVFKAAFDAEVAKDGRTAD